MILSSNLVAVRLATLGVTHLVQLLTGSPWKLVFEARNSGRDLAREGNDILREACKWSPELAIACETWKEIKFEFQAMDTV